VLRACHRKHLLLCLLPQRAAARAPVACPSHSWVHIAGLQAPVQQQKVQGRHMLWWSQGREMCIHNLVKAPVLKLGLHLPRSGPLSQAGSGIVGAGHELTKPSRHHVELPKCIA
jgi:hypothetical protein